MKNVMKTAIAAALALGAVASAHAAVSGETTESADVVFTETTPAVTLTLIPVTGLAAGHLAGDTPLIMSDIKTDDAVQHAVRWTPGTFTASAQNADSAVISGKDNTDNKLTVKILDLPGGNPLSLRDGEYRGFSIPQTETAFVIGADGDQTVNPDTYTVSVDAAIYNP